jgi:hypothetical protein
VTLLALRGRAKVPTLSPATGFGSGILILRAGARTISNSGTIDGFNQAILDADGLSTDKVSCLMS